MSHSGVSVRYKYTIVREVSQKKEEREIQVHGRERSESEEGGA